MPGLVPSQLPWLPGTAVWFSFLLHLYEGAEDTCTTVGPPWPDLFRPSTPSRPFAGAALKDVGGRNTERAMEQPISLNRTAVGQTAG